MKISRSWLQSFFDTPLPHARALADALTFHAFEIESVENDILDVSVLPNRGHDCLCHRGIAKEASAILSIPMKRDPLRDSVSLEPKAKTLHVSIKSKECSRYTAGYIRGISVQESPVWLKEALQSIGQKPINNIVDAANFVMFNIGQPLHAFDASKLKRHAESYAIEIRHAREGETITGLDNKEYSCDEHTLLIVDGHADVPIGIAGIKGGKSAEVSEATTEIIIESANFNSVSVRRSARALKLRTDASSRFEQGISSELAPYGMQAVVNLILELAGGEVVGYVDEYPTPQQEKKVSVTAAMINKTLGTILSEKEIANVWTKLDLPFERNEDVYTIEVPFERLDLSLPEDLVEEVGRIVGYEKVAPVPLPSFSVPTPVNKNFYAAESVREEFIANGFSEVFTSVFADSGKEEVLNKVGGDRPFLRESLMPGLLEALEKNKHNKDILGLKEVKLFEIGTVWKKGGESIVVGAISEKGKETEKPLADAVAKDVPSQYENFSYSQAVRYEPFSRYPFIVRDIALWTPPGTEADAVLETIRDHAGELLVRSELFDRFEKGDKVSLAFRLVFQSFDRTLTDGAVEERMESIYSAVKKEGWEVR